MKWGGGGQGKMVQLVKSLPSKGEALSAVPQNLHTKRYVGICSPDTGGGGKKEMDARSSLDSQTN